jgi:hypothetical protein
MSLDGGQVFFSAQNLIPNQHQAADLSVPGTDLTKDEAEVIFMRYIKEFQVDNAYVYREQLL